MPMDQQVLGAHRSDPVRRRPVGRSPIITLLAGVTFFGLVTTGVQAKPDLTTLTRQDIKVRASQITSFGPSENGRRYGGLIFRGGLQLRSSSSAFGGFSGLRLTPDGRSFIAVSDAGFWMRGDIGYDGRKPARISNAEVGPLRALSGAVLTGNSEIDAEGIEILGADIRKAPALISFERIHRIGQFKLTKDGISKPSRYLKLPPAARILKSNRGLETLAQFKSGPHKGKLIYFA
ncbi:MAG: esterase-like activity of phytase family protein, partial [Pseudomonadota bacterium]